MIDRRAALTGLSAAILSSCTGEAATTDAAPLKSFLTAPLGVAAMTAEFADPQWQALTATHFDRLTPEWEMKMEYILQSDGSHRFEAPDRLLRQAKLNRQGIFGHALVWYAQDGAYFQNLRSDKARFEAAYRAYVQAVVGRYTGQVDGWDVVNEPILDDGSGLRNCLWRDVLGDYYIDIAYHAAHGADPACPLVLNDYNLEHTPAKRRQFLKLVDDMQKRGVPLHVLGTQTHISAALEPGALKATLRDLAATGLKIHVSEVDVSLKEAAKNAFDFKSYRAQQIRQIEELAEAWLSLPVAQQYGITIWGLRDKDSWYNRSQKGLLADEPLLFDDTGALKPLGQAFVKALR
ncbi:endo-1,4-beta-xylanase [Asticcacaulis sp. BYS171W]|uniref:Beta-xylanase n=1 Tax=Asticcacaulis aquaticus TaxID=2984212 RepID=A0ABT5HT06_9CAUL|nr:endo-1,4-beta-xylanase [Asticcacaulis aquaticus]MDC7683187.1 endo-1,4-beta-xylanase [Asticcacaulis aquaticus]